MKENWLALYLAIVKGINASKALTLMKAGKTRKKSCGNSSKLKKLVI